MSSRTESSRTESSSTVSSSTVSTTSVALLDRALEMHPQVALRPEPFGALAYHYDTRRLVLLKHVDVVDVVRALGDHPSVRETLDACGIDERRRPAFASGLDRLVESGVLRDRTR